MFCQELHVDHVVRPVVVELNKKCLFDRIDGGMDLLTGYFYAKCSSQMSCTTYKLLMYSCSIVHNIHVSCIQQAPD
jgi:hypothetical protein